MADSVDPSPDDPDWSLLPRDPVRFFALDEGFDRKDLKRSYNRLLRRYKPEKHPDEFQRVRAAFEELERRLRYGQSAEATASSWDEGKEPSPKSDDSEPSALGLAKEEVAEESTDLQALAARLESGETTVEETHNRLKKIKRKTPPDYYALALTADATGSPDDLLFLRWLLKGLAEWPGDPALSRLVYSYLGDQVPIERLPQVLVACSKAVPNDGFFELTEGGWDRLLRGKSFAAFSKTLAMCEEQLSHGQDASVRGRVAFYIHALRFALWKDSTGWTERALAFVEDHYDQAPDHLENDYDALGIVQEYLVHREEFTSGHELRKRMDRVLELAFTADQIESDRAMVAMQAELRGSPQALAAAFSPEPSEASSAFYTLWSWMAQDTASRYAPPDDAEPDYKLWRSRIIDHTHGLVHDRSRLRTIWHLMAMVKSAVYGLGYLIVPFLSFLVVFFAAIAGAESFLGMELVERAILASLPFGIGAVVGSIFLWRRSWKRYVDEKWWPSYCERMAIRSYRRNWRPQAFAFLEKSLLDYFTYRGLVEEQGNRHGDERSWISLFVAQDFGLAFYAIAQRFRA